MQAKAIPEASCVDKFMIENIACSSPLPEATSHGCRQSRQHISMSLCVDMLMHCRVAHLSDFRFFLQPPQQLQLARLVLAAPEDAHGLIPLWVR